MRSETGKGLPGKPGTIGIQKTLIKIGNFLKYQKKEGENA